MKREARSAGHQVRKAVASKYRAQPYYLQNLTTKQSLGYITTQEINQEALLKKSPKDKFK